jgi:hypothetical protein
MPALSASQIEVAQSLASGMSIIKAANVAGVDRRTIQRWQKQEAFNREVSDRRALREAGERISEAKQVSPSGFNLTGAIADLREAKKATRLRVRAAGSSLLEKCCERLTDLPSEAISPALLPQYFKVGRDLLEWADQAEAEELELSELTEQLLGSDSLVSQKVQIETSENIDRSFQAIAESGEFSEREKLKIFEIIAGTHVSD